MRGTELLLPIVLVEQDGSAARRSFLFESVPRFFMTGTNRVWEVVEPAVDRIEDAEFREKLPEHRRTNNSNTYTLHFSPEVVNVAEKTLEQQFKRAAWNGIAVFVAPKRRHREPSEDAVRSVKLLGRPNVLSVDCFQSRGEQLVLLEDGSFAKWDLESNKLRPILESRIKLARDGSKTFILPPGKKKVLADFFAAEKEKHTSSVRLDDLLDLSCETVDLDDVLIRPDEFIPFVTEDRVVGVFQKTSSKLFVLRKKTTTTFKECKRLAVGIEAATSVANSFLFRMRRATWPSLVDFSLADPFELILKPLLEFEEDEELCHEEERWFTVKQSWEPSFRFSDCGRVSLFGSRPRVPRIGTKKDDLIWFFVIKKGILVPFALQWAIFLVGDQATCVFREHTVFDLISMSIERNEARVAALGDGVDSSRLLRQDCFCVGPLREGFPSVVDMRTLATFVTWSEGET